MTPVQTQKPKKFEKLANLFKITRDALKRKLIQPAVFDRQKLALAGYGAISKDDARFGDKNNARSLLHKPMMMGGGQWDSKRIPDNRSYGNTVRIKDSEFAHNMVQQLEKSLKIHHDLVREYNWSGSAASDKTLQEELADWKNREAVAKKEGR
ncbi:MAG: hypothetical protein M1530_03925 [Candidatus Marsarchaeota archaeon]|nr:hypothetical protein [Candidatus Marsarchaeota archaeon]